MNGVLHKVIDRVHEIGLVRVAVIAFITVVAGVTFGGAALGLLLFTVVIPALQSNTTALATPVIETLSNNQELPIPAVLTMLGLPADVNSVIDSAQEQYLGGEASENEEAGYGEGMFEEYGYGYGNGEVAGEQAERE